MALQINNVRPYNIFIWYLLSLLHALTQHLSCFPMLSKINVCKIRCAMAKNADRTLNVNLCM